MTRFGFESEYHINASALIAQLHSAGLAAAPTLHRYHCDCSGCESTLPYRGQSDASCSGEIISTVFEYIDDAPISELSEAAYEVDAEPGLTSGFHVHVSDGDFVSSHRVDALWEFARWESVLSDHIANGAFGQMRGFNRMVRSATAGLTYATLVRGNAIARETKRDAYDRHFHADRHSNLCINTRHDTFEFRLWNSTRAAWRMRMYVLLSCAFIDRNFIEHSQAYSCAANTTMDQRCDDLVMLLSASGHEEASQLAARQLTYTRTGNYPSQFAA